MNLDPIIIIGTGLSGYQLARELRRLNADVPLMMITADDGRYYSKPQLSTAFTNQKTAEHLATATAEEMSQQLKASILTHQAVIAVDSSQQLIRTEDQQFHYSQLVFACGADVIKPPLAGDAVASVLSVNHLYHYAEFQKLIHGKKHITILGAGLIGCEFANDLSNAGFEVHVVAPAKAPLDLLVPEIVGKVLQEALEKNGVHFHLEKLPSRVDHRSGHLVVTLSDHAILETEFVLSAIGLLPHTKLAKTANLAMNRGILVNKYLETSAPHIYALGDCAEVEGHVLPYITPLLNCAKALAKTLAGEKTAVQYPAMPVVVKTPAHPVVICPPPKQIVGEWKIEKIDGNVRALFFSDDKLYGFVLTNDLVKERMSLAQKIPNLF